MKTTNKFRYTKKYLVNEKNLLSKIDILIKVVSNFSCKKCSDCCKAGSPNVLSDEYKDHPKRNIIWKDNDRVNLRSPCPYLTKNCCNIYDNRPRLCKIFPLMLSLNSDYIIVWDCELGRIILKKYKIFLKDNDMNSGVDISNASDYPFCIFENNIENIINFLVWLKK